jgi:hypothetical protein
VTTSDFDAHRFIYRNNDLTAHGPLDLRGLSRPAVADAPTASAARCMATRAASFPAPVQPFSGLSVWEHTGKLDFAIGRSFHPERSLIAAADTVKMCDSAVDPGHLDAAFETGVVSNRTSIGAFSLKEEPCRRIASWRY